MTPPDIPAMADAIRRGERQALARAITLVESRRGDHRAAAADLLDLLATAAPEALRIGLSGTPGVGKSTFIEAFGMGLCKCGHRVAVLAVDPSSARSGGSILGDKTRMERLARHPGAFIRPSPAQSELGGVARRTREAVTLCEAAGYDTVLVETVGVGQSETMVADMTDVFVLLLAPGGGDELQGVKRGIMEMADIILINKADGALESVAARTCADYAGALRLMRRRAQDPENYPLALSVSAQTGTGMDAAREAMTTLAAWRRDNGHFAKNRAAQNRFWFEEEVRQGMLANLRADPATRAALDRLGVAVATGERPARAAASEVLAALTGLARG